MPKRPDITIIRIAADRTIRADLTGSPPRIAHLDIQPSPRGDPTDRIAALLKKTQPAAGTYLIDDGAWTETVSIPDAALRGLDAVAIAGVLSYELEPNSGVAAAEAAVSFLEVDAPSTDERAFWITETKKAERSGFERILKECGTTMRGVAAPCGFVETVVDPGTATIEVIDTATVCRSKGRIVVIAARCGQRYWIQGVLDFLRKDAFSRINWIGAARPTALGDVSREFIFVDRGEHPLEADPTRFFESAARALVEGKSVPIVGPLASSSRKTSATLIALLLSLAVAVGAVFDMSTLRARAERLEKEANTQESARGRVERLKKSRAAVERQIAELAKTNEPEERRFTEIAATLKSERSRIAKLLEALARKKPNGVLISRVEPRPAGSLEVSGIGIESGAINSFIAETAKELDKASWDVRPAAVGEKKNPAGRVYYEFTFSLAPFDPQRSAKETAPKTRKRSE